MLLDQGIRFSKASLLSESIFSKLSKRYTKYFSTISLLALAVSIMLYNLALAVAPLAVLANKKFFLPITKGLIALSAALLSISNDTSNNTFFSPGKCFLAYSNALPNGLPLAVHFLFPLQHIQ